MLHSKETEWDVTNAETQHHYDMISTQMKLAAEKLEKVVDATKDLCKYI